MDNIERKEKLKMLTKYVYQTGSKAMFFSNQIGTKSIFVKSNDGDDTEIINPTAIENAKVVADELMRATTMTQRYHADEVYGSYDITIEVEDVFDEFY